MQSKGKKPNIKKTKKVVKKEQQTFGFEVNLEEQEPDIPQQVSNDGFEEFKIIQSIHTEPEKVQPVIEVEDKTIMVSEEIQKVQEIQTIKQNEQNAQVTTSKHVVQLSQNQAKPEFLEILNNKQSHQIPVIIQTSENASTEKYSKELNFPQSIQKVENDCSKINQPIQLKNQQKICSQIEQELDIFENHSMNAKITQQIIKKDVITKAKAGKKKKATGKTTKSSNFSSILMQAELDDQISPSIDILASINKNINQDVNKQFKLQKLDVQNIQQVNQKFTPSDQKQCISNLTTSIQIYSSHIDQKHLQHQQNKLQTGSSQIELTNINQQTNRFLTDSLMVQENNLLQPKTEEALPLKIGEKQHQYRQENIANTKQSYEISQDLTFSEMNFTMSTIHSKKTKKLKSTKKEIKLKSTQSFIKEFQEDAIQEQQQKLQKNEEKMLTSQILQITPIENKQQLLMQQSSVKPLEQYKYQQPKQKQSEKVIEQNNPNFAGLCDAKVSVQQQNLFEKIIQKKQKQPFYPKIRQPQPIIKRKHSSDEDPWICKPDMNTIINKHLKKRAIKDKQAMLSKKKNEQKVQFKVEVSEQKTYPSNLQENNPIQISEKSQIAAQVVNSEQLQEEIFSKKIYDPQNDSKLDEPSENKQPLKISSPIQISQAETNEIISKTKDLDINNQKITSEMIVKGNDLFCKSNEIQKEEQNKIIVNQQPIEQQKSIVTKQEDKNNENEIQNVEINLSIVTKKKQTVKKASKTKQYKAKSKILDVEAFKIQENFPTVIVQDQELQPAIKKQELINQADKQPQSIDKILQQALKEDVKIQNQQKKTIIEQCSLHNEFTKKTNKIQNKLFENQQTLRYNLKQQVPRQALIIKNVPDAIEPIKQSQIILPQKHISLDEMRKQQQLSPPQLILQENKQSQLIKRQLNESQLKRQLFEEEDFTIDIKSSEVTKSKTKPKKSNKKGAQKSKPKQKATNSIVFQNILEEKGKDKVENVTNLMSEQPKQQKILLNSNKIQQNLPEKQIKAVINQQTIPVSPKIYTRTINQIKDTDPITKSKSNEIIDSKPVLIIKQVEKIQSPSIQNKPQNDAKKAEPRNQKNDIVTELVNLIRFHNDEDIKIMRQRMKMLEEDIRSRLFRNRGLTQKKKEKINISTTNSQLYKEIIEENISLQDEYRTINSEINLP